MKKIQLLLLLLFLYIGAYTQPLFSAIAEKDTVKAVELLKSGENINLLNSYGSTVLMQSCRYGYDTVMEKFLLQHGANPDNPRSPKGRTTLIIASAYYGGIPMVRLLLQYGADINAVTNDGVTALMMAAQSAKSDLVAYLLEHGAIAAAKDAQGKTALDYANKAQVDEYTIKSMPESKVDKAATIAILLKATGNKP